jgi:HlyD family secretion protein
MSVRRSLIVLTLVALGLPAAIFGMGANQMQASQQTASTIQYSTVQRGDVRVDVTATGVIEADDVVNLSLTTAGKVAELFVKEGDYVLVGDPILRRENDAERLAHERALLALQVAQVRLDDILAPVDEDDIRVAQANVDAAWGAYADIDSAVSAEDIQAAQLRYDQAMQAMRDAERARQIAGGLSEEEFTLLEAQIGEASFNAEVARLQLEDLRSANQGDLGAAYARVQEAQRKLEQVMAGPTDAEIDRARVAVEQAQVEVSQAEEKYNETLLVSPAEGVISNIETEIGELVTPGSTLVELTDINPLHITVEVDEIDIRQIEIGMPAQVELDALPGALLEARLTDVALFGREEDGIVSYDVDIDLASNDERARVGMTAEASITVEEKRDVLVIPNQYIRLDRGRGQAFVNIQRPDGTLEEVEIRLGLQGQDTSEVLSGLNEGDVIALDLSDRFSLFGGS